MRIKTLACSLSFALLGSQLVAQEANNSYAHQVNTLIGTEGAGLTSGYLYPNATYPYGMVQFTPSYFAKYVGFVINQLSGAGCEHMGNFPAFSLAGKLELSPNIIRNARITVNDERGHAGLYETTVQGNTLAQLTVTERTGMTRYQFPTDEAYGTVIIGAGVAATPITEAAIVITAPNRCEGYAEGGNFCGTRTPYKVYSVAEFDAPAVETGTWKRHKLHREATFAVGETSGVYFTFDTSKQQTVQYKIGVSYVSVENARQNLEAENRGRGFDAVRKQAESKWNEYIGKIEVEGSDLDRITQFYTHLYRTFIHSNVCSNVNGEYMGADFKVRRTHRKQYTLFSNRDMYRTQIQLLAMLDPEVASDVVVSHQQFAEQSGDSFPHWVMVNIETGIMQGDPTSILIANAYAFGACNYGHKPIFDIMRKGAEVPGSKSQGQETRPGLKQYLDKGYYNASEQQGYTSSDFAIAQFALHAADNEPSFQIPWVYNWVGAPYKTQQTVNRILIEAYSSQDNGLPSSDALGSMGAWYVFACMGLYPEIPSVGGFAVNTPIFQHIKIHLPKGDILIKGGSEKNMYIHAIKLNGQKYENTWIDWKDLQNGGTIEYVTFQRPYKQLGTKVLPPSYP